MQRISERSKSPDDTRLQVLTRTLLHEVAADLDTYWGGGDISPSVYETAWVAMVRDPRHPQRLAFPQSLEWLLRVQQLDGSWQSSFPHSILPTMAAMLALSKAPRPTLPVSKARARALKYLCQVLPQWDVATYDTPLFEFLTPLLADELLALGIWLPIPHLELLKERQTEKLQRLPLDLIYTGQSNLIHGLEALRSVLDYTRLHSAQSPHGGYGNSPSATASVLIYGPAWDERAAGWLQRLGDITGAMPSSHPADTFEVAWVLHFLLQGGQRLDPKRNATHRLLLQWLQDSLTEDGAGYARWTGLPRDADDTAVVLTVLHRSGIHVSSGPLWHFEIDHHFVSYAGERTSSTSANAHVLEALLSARLSASHDRDLFLRHKRATRKVVQYLLQQRERSGFWIDKWHLSPYYATLSSLLALCRVPDPAMHQDLLSTFNWLLDTQNVDGSWGASGPSTEESAYALLAIRALRNVLPFHQSERCIEVLTRGRAQLKKLWQPIREALYLQAPSDAPNASGTMPALWIDKSTYAPSRVIRAAILAALR